MRLLIGANIIMDVLQEREPYYFDSSTVWKLCETGKCEGYISTLTFANIMYVMRKELSAEQIETVLQQLMFIFNFTELTKDDLVSAVKLNWNDFEDAVQKVTADKVKADFIITRDIKHFSKSNIMALTPAEFLARI